MTRAPVRPTATPLAPSAFRAELEAFTDVVAGTRTPPCTVDDALAVGFIAKAATLSLKKHRSVQIDEVRHS